MNIQLEPAASRSRFSGTTSRAVALFLGIFSVANAVGDFLRPGFAEDLWWVDLRFLPVWLGKVLLLVASVCLISFAWQPPRPGWRRRLTAACAGALSLVALANAIRYYTLLAGGRLGSNWPFPLSLLIAAALGSVCLAALARPRPNTRPGGRAMVFVLTLVFCALFPLLQMFCFGKTDYRRPADVAIVFGARAYADGRPSDALADRVRTACELYRRGLTRKLVFSGGPGDGVVHETECMRRMALGLGVRPEDILVDREGFNTRATVRNTKKLLRQTGSSRVLVVSHFYHLPRIKLAFQRAGVEVYTVPARESYVLRQLPFNMAREIAALWVYYLRC